MIFIVIILFFTSVYFIVGIVGTLAFYLLGMKLFEKVEIK